MCEPTLVLGSIVEESVHWVIIPSKLRRIVLVVSCLSRKRRPVVHELRVETTTSKHTVEEAHGEVPFLVAVRGVSLVLLCLVAQATSSYGLHCCGKKDRSNQYSSSTIPAKAKPSRILTSASPASASVIFLQNFGSGSMTPSPMI